MILIGEDGRMTEERKDFSHELKLVAATNMAVAQAILEATAAQKGGTPAIPISDRLQGMVKGALKALDAIR